MSDASSAVTYTFVYIDTEPWRYYEEESDETGSPGVIVYGYDELLMQPHPHSPVEVPYVPESEYPEYLAPSDDEAPLEDQSLPADASSIAASPGYVADSDPNEDLEEDPEDDHAEYPVDGGDGDDEPSNNDDDDTDSDPDEDLEEEPFEDEDDDEEEERLASADSSAVPIVDLVLTAGDTYALKADEPTPTPGSPHTIIPLSQTRLRRARKTVRPESSMSASMEACIARHAALLSPPLPIPYLPLPLPSPLTTSSTDTGVPLGYKAAEIGMRALLPSTSRMTDIPEAGVPPQKRACLTTPILRFKVRESSAVGSARQPGPTESNRRRYRVEQVGYGITNTWDEIVNTLMEIAPTTLEGVDQGVTKLDTTVRQRTDKFEIRFEEAQDDRAFLRARTSSLQTQLTTALGRIEILEARDLKPQEGPKITPKKRTTRATLATTTTPTTAVIDAQLQALIDRGVVTALVECDVDRSRNGDNNNDSRTCGRRQMTTLRECTYTNFLKCQPKSFQGTERVIGLTRWLEKMKFVFQISNCAISCQVKFAYCILQGSALMVKYKQEKDKIRTKPDENGKRGRAQQCQSPVTVEKAKKRRKYKL
nr:hypothetical protein [Tanacetum cinerariifolium]